MGQTDEALKQLDSARLIKIFDNLPKVTRQDTADRLREFVANEQPELSALVDYVNTDPLSKRESTQQIVAGMLVAMAVLAEYARTEDYQEPFGGILVSR